MVSHEFSQSFWLEKIFKEPIELQVNKIKEYNE